MKNHVGRKLFSGLLLGLFLSGCGADLQNIMGQDFLTRAGLPTGLQSAPVLPTAQMLSSEPDPAQAAANFQAALQAAAATEPMLTFPAKIGIARIDGQEVSIIPPDEATAWTQLAQKIGPDFGEFTVLNPLVAEMMSQNMGASYGPGSGNVMQKVRLGAAQQHLDAVLVYMTYTKSEISKNLLALGDLTVLAGFL